MKVLVLSALGFWDYGPRYEVFSRFARLGHEIHYVSPIDNKKDLQLKNVFFYKVNLPLNTGFALIRILFVLLSLKKAIEIFKITKPDIIYGYGEHCVLQAYLISRIYAIPLITRFQGVEAAKSLVGKVEDSFLYYHPSKLLWYPFFYQMLAFKVPANAYIITNDGTQGDVLARYFNVPEEKIKFWMNGTIPRIAKNGFDTESFKKKLELQKDVKIVLSLCRLERWKGVHRLIEAISSVVKERDDVVFLIVGNGSERGRLEQLVLDLSVSKYVRFIGHVLHENIRKYYAIADIYVTLQDISCLSASLLEAMICGDCIIALNTGDTRQVIKNNQNGILLNYSELNSLPSVLLELLNNEKYRRMLANNAKKFAINKVWTWEKRADAEIKLVERLIQESS